MKTRLNEISIMRVILILLIVIGHVFAVFGSSQSWPLPSGWSANYIYSLVNPITISFALQTFVFISGYLFAYQHLNKSITFFSTLKNKLSRLYLPTIFWGILYSCIVLRTDLFDIKAILNIISGVGHLWFLPMLFWCFVVMQLFINMLSIPKIATFICLTLLSGLSLFIPSILRIQEFGFYFIYFVLGYWTFGQKTKFVNKKLNVCLIWGAVVILCVLKCLLLSGNFNLKYPSMYMWCIKYLLGIFGALALYLSALKLNIDKGDTSKHKVLDWQGWFGIYIIHQFVLKLLYYKTDYCSLVHSPWITLFVVLMSSVVLVVIFRKFRIGRRLL